MTRRAERNHPHPASPGVPGEGPERDARDRDATWDYQTVPASAIAPFVSRGALLAVGAIACGGIVVHYAQQSWLSIVALLLSDGLCAAFWVLAAAALGEVVVRPARWGARGALRFATAAGAGLGAFGLVVLALGLAGALNRATAIALPVASVVLWVVVIGRTSIRPTQDISGAPRAWLRVPAGWHWLFVFAMPALAVAIAGASILPGVLWKPDDPHPYDVVSYHLQVPHEWYELGRIVPLAHNAFSFFPFNVEMHFLAGMHVRGGPWAGMYFAQFLCLAYALLAVAATYGAARLVAGRAGATTAALSVAGTPWMVMTAPVAFVEGALVFYVALSLGWVVLALWRPTAERPAPASSAPPARGALAIAGAFAGVACGVKLTAGPMLLLAAPVAMVAAALVTRRRVGRAMWDGVLFGFFGMVVLSPWLIRNVAWTGNPVFPNATGLFGSAHFSPGQVERYVVAHQLPVGGAVARLGGIVQKIVLQWQFGYAIIPLALLCLAATLTPRRDKKTSAPGVKGVAVLLAVVVLMQLVFWVGFTHLIGRFFMPAIPALALLIALAAGRTVLRPIVASVVVVAALVGWLADTSGDGGINGRLDRFANLGRQGLFALDDVGVLQPPELQQIYDAGGTVHFVGDAQTFLHRAKASQVPYRSVFDVRADSDDPVTAWTGRPLSDLPAGQWVLIDPLEIHRLAGTYRHVPDVPASYPGPRDRPYLMNRDAQVIVPVR